MDQRNAGSERIQGPGLATQRKQVGTLCPLEVPLCQRQPSSPTGRSHPAGTCRAAHSPSACSSLVDLTTLPFFFCFSMLWSVSSSYIFGKAEVIHRVSCVCVCEVIHRVSTVCRGGRQKLYTVSTVCVCMCVWEGRSYTQSFNCVCVCMWHGGCVWCL